MVKESVMSDMLVRMPPEARVGKRIRRLRESVPRRTQGDFALLLGVTRAAVTNWERGKGIKFENLNKIAHLCKIGVDWLMNGPDEGPIPFQIVPRTDAQTMANMERESATIPIAEAIDALVATLLALKGGNEDRAQMLAQAVLRVGRTPSPVSGQLPNAQEMRSLIATVVHLFPLE